jgi:hypothetical protein
MEKKGNGKEKSAFVQNLLEIDEAFKKAFDVHKDYESKLAELDSRQYLTTEDQVERKKLQKKKLVEKDRMEVMIQRHKNAS